nr:Mitochondrial substrate solute carrier domain containing protein [Haemonchus contortus]
MYADFIAGWAAGGAGLLVGHPLDTVKARLQTMNAYKGIVDCAIKTARQETLRSMAYTKGCGYRFYRLVLYIRFFSLATV